MPDRNVYPCMHAYQLVHYHVHNHFMRFCKFSFVECTCKMGLVHVIVGKHACNLHESLNMVLVALHVPGPVHFTCGYMLKHCMHVHVHVF